MKKLQQEKRTGPFGFTKAHHSHGLLLWQTTTLWQLGIKNILKPYKITHTQFVIMAILLWGALTDEGANQSYICKQSKLDKMTVSKALKVLQKKGYLTSTASSRDGRSNSIFITAAGAKIVHALVPLVEKFDKQFFSALGPVGNKKLFLSFLQRLVALTNT